MKEHEFQTSGLDEYLCTATTGAIGELLVAVDLLKKGYEVFRALSPSCTCDLMAWKDGVATRIEVKKGSVGRNGNIYYACVRVDEDRADVLALVVEGDIYYKKIVGTRVVGLERDRTARKKLGMRGLSTTP